MNVTTVTVSYGLTVNLGDYSNVRPEVSLTAELGPRESADDILADLLQEARMQVEYVADEALEQHDQVARYSSEPRYKLIRSLIGGWRHGERVIDPPVIAIVPAGTKPPDGYTGLIDGDGARLAHAQQIAERRAMDAADTVILDCTDGNLERLPKLPELDPEPAPPNNSGELDDWDDDGDGGE